MSPFRIHRQLSNAIRAAASMREELEMGRASQLRRLTLRVRHARASSRIRRLTRRLHAA